MKLSFLTAFIPLFLGLSLHSSGQISIHGSSLEYTSTNPDWLTMSENDPDNDGGLGTDGFIFFGNFNGTSQAAQPFSSSIRNLPTYVSAFTAGADFGAVADGFVGYGSIDDPILLNGNNTIAGIATASASTNSLAGSSNEILTFTISEVPVGSAVRVGVLSGIEPSADGRWDPTSISLSNGPSTVSIGDHTISPLAINPGEVNTGWVFFDIQVAGNYSLSVTQRFAGNRGGSIAGLTFDTRTNFVNPDGSLNFSITPPVGGFTFPNAFPGLNFNEIAAMETLPGDPNRLFVIERRGRVWMIPDVTAETPTRQLFLDLQSTLLNGGNITLNGMGGIAFHPDFQNNGYFYVSYPRRNQWSRISRFTADPDTFARVNTSTEQVLIQESYHRAHGINRLVFGPDGYLYVPMGDGRQFEFGNPRLPDRTTQAIDAGFWSSILRLDVDKRPGNFEPQNLVGTDGTNGIWNVPTTNGLAHYSIPNDNPFLDTDANDGTGVSSAFGRQTIPTQVRTEMFCIGFRNPWKMGFVPGTSDIWVADVMSALKERYMIMPKGGNAGWGFFSGTGDVEFLHNASDLQPQPNVDYVQPVVEYRVTDNDSGANNKSIIGGEFYLSTDIPFLTNAFIMCDFNRGDIWAVHRDNHSSFQALPPQLISDSANDANDTYAISNSGIETTTLGGVFEFGTYQASVQRIGIQAGITAMIPNPATGEMLLADFGSGIIRKMVFTPGDFNSQLPIRLSSTGAFTDTENFILSDGMKPYDVNLTFWSDGAIKDRFLNLVKADEPIEYSQDGFWSFPRGTITMKHFDMDLDRDNPGTNIKRLETRFLIQTDNEFYGMTYAWNEDETDAILVGEDGGTIDLDIKENGITTHQEWRIPSRGECYQCHTTENNAMLGLNTRQLNYEGELDGESGNFLQLLQDAGYLSDLGTDNPETLPRYSIPSDESVDIQERVKSYLAVNCAYCHYQENGLVPQSWSAEHHLSIAENNVLHSEGIGFNIIDTTDRLIIPGDTANSIILSRATAANGYTRMPPIGSNVIDEEGAELIRDWINNYANTPPIFAEQTEPLTIAENSSTTTIGSSPTATELDLVTDRNTLTYSIINGNDDGYFDIKPATGELLLVRTDLDFELAPKHTLTLQVSDNFGPNPGEATTSLQVDVIDILNDDSQNDGIQDEWALAFLGTSNVNPLADSDGDGTVNLLEFWANSDPRDPSQRFVLNPTERTISDTGQQLYSFEFQIRNDLIFGQDYFIHGCDDLVTFVNIIDGANGNDVDLNNQVDNTLRNVKVTIPSNSDQYFIRVSNASE